MLENQEFTDTFKLTEMILSWIGLKIFYPPKQTGFINWIKSEWLYVLCFLQLFSTVIGELIYLFNALGQSFLEVTALAPCIGFCVLGMIKMHAISTSRRVMQKLIEEIKLLWPQDDCGDVKKSIKEKYLKRAHSSTKIFFWQYTILILLFNCDPLFTMAYKYFTTKTIVIGLPYFVWYPFDAFKPGIYQVIYVYQMCSGFIAGLGMVAPDCLFQVVCSHITMLLRILQEDILNIIPDIDIEEAHQIDNQHLMEKLNNIINKHQKLIHLAEDLSNIYSLVMMIILTGSSFIICLVGFQATAGDTTTLAKFTLFLLNSLSHVLLLSWYGNNLIEMSTNIAEAAYNCKWYLTNSEFKKSLLFIITRSQKPLVITALSFSIISLKSFTSICSTSWSYFTLLRTVYEPN